MKICTVQHEVHKRSALKTNAPSFCTLILLHAQVLLLSLLFSQLSHPRCDTTTMMLLLKPKITSKITIIIIIIVNVNTDFHLSVFLLLCKHISLRSFSVAHILIQFSDVSLFWFATQSEISSFNGVLLQ